MCFSPRIFQSTCPARGTTEFGEFISGVMQFQSTCPARGTTNLLKAHFLNVALFQSTCPARGTTTHFGDGDFLFEISIHVPREGHDPRSSVRLRRGSHFNPRAPRGARLMISCNSSRDTANFNPRAPRGARPFYMPSHNSLCQHFNPRAPRGARQQTCTIFSCRFAQELQISR